MPKEYRIYGQSWLDHGYRLIDWTEATIPNIINRNVWDEIANGVNVGGGIPEVGVAVQRADMLSYELTWVFGGIYANCDMECKRPLPLEDLDAFAAWEVQDAFVGSAIFGCVHHNAFFGKVIEELPKRYFDMRHSPMNETTGPHLLTDCHRRFSGLTVFDEKLFYPYNYGDMHLEGHPELWENPNPYTEHRWGHKHPELLQNRV